MEEEKVSNGTGWFSKQSGLSFVVNALDPFVQAGCPFDQRARLSLHCMTRLREVANMLTHIMRDELSLCAQPEKHALLPTRITVLLRLASLFVQPMRLQGADNRRMLVIFPQTTEDGHIRRPAFWYVASNTPEFMPVSTYDYCTSYPPTQPPGAPSPVTRR